VLEVATTKYPTATPSALRMMSSTSNTPTWSSSCVLSIATPTASAIPVTAPNLSECFERNGRNNPSGTNGAIFPMRLFFCDNLIYEFNGGDNFVKIASWRFPKS